MPDSLKVSALHARSVNAFLRRLPSLNTARVAQQRFHIKRLFLGYRYFDIFLRFGLDRVLRNTDCVEGRGYKTHGPRAEKFRPVLSSSMSLF
jgi:hypothetical protein